MTEDDRDDRMLADARSYNEPPDPPRERMWAVIREELPRAEALDRRGGDALDLDVRRRARRRERLRRWTPWALGLAAAAAFTVGFGLGRITGAVDPAPAALSPAGPDRSLAVRLAASEHMGEAEAMLTLFRSSDREEDRAAVAGWARDLLGTTRLLIDSRVAEDPEVAQLLGDLELMLVQIATAATDPAERELIEEGIEERQLLSKLRSAGSSTGGAL